MELLVSPRTRRQETASLKSKIQGKIKQITEKEKMHTLQVKNYSKQLNQIKKATQQFFIQENNLKLRFDDLAIMQFPKPTLVRQVTLGQANAIINLTTS